MPRVSRPRKTRYSVHPGVAMMQKWVAELPEKTGRSLEQWIELVRREGPPTQAQRRDWLKNEHGLGTNAAWWIAERADPDFDLSLADDDPERYLQAAERYVAEMFAGPKAPLRPVYDRLLELGLSLGADVMACPCKTIVPLYRKHVFAEIKPATRTRIDFGLALGKATVRLPVRLIDTGGQAKKERITDRFAITRLEEIDGEVGRWLRRAYELDV